MGCDKRTKSFSLKADNINKVEKISYEQKRKQSEVVDEMIEVFEYGDK